MIQFAKDFIFFTATAAYQIEGEWNDDGKGQSIWEQTPICMPNGLSGRGILPLPPSQMDSSNQRRSKQQDPPRNP